MPQNMPTPSSPSGAAPAPAPAPPRRRPVPDSVLILGGFLLVTAALAWMMSSGSSLSRDSSAAERLVAEGKYREAVPHLQAVIERFPSAWIRQLQLGNCYLELGEPDKALKTFQAALEYTDDVNVKEGVGIACYELGDRDQAMATFAEVMKARPHSPAASYYLGVEAFNHGKDPVAAKAFQAAAADPKWDERARPWRQKLAQRVLGAAPAGPPRDTCLHDNGNDDNHEYDQQVSD